MTKTTYKDLLAWLENLTPEQLDRNVTLYDLEGDKFQTIDAVARLRDDDPSFDPIDGGQPVLLLLK